MAAVQTPVVRRNLAVRCYLATVCNLWVSISSSPHRLRFPGVDL